MCLQRHLWRGSAIFHRYCVNYHTSALTRNVNRAACVYLLGGNSHAVGIRERCARASFWRQLYSFVGGTTIVDVALLRKRGATLPGGQTEAFEHPIRHISRFSDALNTHRPICYVDCSTEILYIYCPRSAAALKLMLRRKWFISLRAANTAIAQQGWLNNIKCHSHATICTTALMWYGCDAKYLGAHFSWGWPNTRIHSHKICWRVWRCIFWPLHKRHAHTLEFNISWNRCLGLTFENFKCGCWGEFNVKSLYKIILFLVFIANFEIFSLLQYLLIVYVSNFVYHDSFIVTQYKLIFRSSATNSD